MKKIRSAAALLILAAMLAGCGQTPSSGSETTDVTAPSDTTEEVTEYAYPYPDTGYGGEEFGILKETLNNSPKACQAQKDVV